MSEESKYYRGAKYLAALGIALAGTVFAVDYFSPNDVCINNVTGGAEVEVYMKQDGKYYFSHVDGQPVVKLDDLSE